MEYSISSVIFCVRVNSTVAAAIERRVITVREYIGAAKTSRALVALDQICRFQFIFLFCT